MSYRRRASPLHAARARRRLRLLPGARAGGADARQPDRAGARDRRMLGAGVGAGVWRELRRAALLALPLAVVDRAGQRARHPRRADGDRRASATCRCSATPTSRSRRPRTAAILGLRAIALILCGALYTAAVDPDEVLRLFRRVSFRSALTATLATRMVPVLRARLPPAGRRAALPPGAAAVARWR